LRKQCFEDEPLTLRRTAVEQVAAQALASGTITRALLLIAAQENAESKAWLSSLGMETRGLDLEKLEAQINSALGLVALKIVSDAMGEALGKKDAHFVKCAMPGEKFPPYVHLLSAFAFCIVSIIACFLHSEGSRPKFDTEKPFSGLIGPLFLLRSVDEKKQIFQNGMKSYKFLANCREQNIEDWFQHLSRLVNLYLLDDESLKAIGFSRMFGSSLKSLLSASD
jgi:hypothetical protein